jgi:hypothetical protein
LLRIGRNAKTLNQLQRGKKPHLIATITQDTGGPSDASSLTTPSATSPPFSSPATSATPNAGVDALVHKKGSISKTKPVAITATNVLSWFRDNSDAPLSGNSEKNPKGKGVWFGDFHQK